MKLVRVDRDRKVIMSNNKVLISPTPKELEKIKNDLTFNNPLFEQTQKYSKYNSVAVSPYLFYFKEGKDKITKKKTISVPIGYDLKCKNVIDQRVFETIESPPFILTPRGDQVVASNNYYRMNEDALNGIMQLPTGKGKSILGLLIASHYSCKTLILVHKDDLVTGWKNDIELAFGGKVKTGLIKAQKREVGDFLTIATVQTINRLQPDELEKLYSTFGLVIHDEMHNSPARCFGVIDNFKSKYKMGLSATPERSDGLAHVFNLYFGGFCYVYKRGEEENDILPVKVIVKKTNVYFNPLCKFYNTKSFRGFRIVKLNYDGKSANEGNVTIDKVSYTERPKLHFGLIDDYVVTHNDYLKEVCTDIIAEYRKGRSIVAFFTKKEHVRLYADYLESIIGENVVALFYGDTKDNNEVLIQAENGERKITLTTYKKGTEGTNVKAWEVEFLVSSINNGKNVEQAVGRIRRTKEGKISPVIVYDYRHPDVYLMHNHGETRDTRYRKLGFDYGVIKDRTKKNMFTRGYK